MLGNSPETLLSINDLRTHFYTNKGVVRAVDGVDLDIQEKKAVGLVGESGCGKTMTAFPSCVSFLVPLEKLLVEM